LLLIFNRQASLLILSDSILDSAPDYQSDVLIHWHPGGIAGLGFTEATGAHAEAGGCHNAWRCGLFGVLWLLGFRLRDFVRRAAG